MRVLACVLAAVSLLTTVACDPAKGDQKPKPKAIKVSGVVTGRSADGTTEASGWTLTIRTKNGKTPTVGVDHATYKACRPGTRYPKCARS